MPKIELAVTMKCMRSRCGYKREMAVETFRESVPTCPYDGMALAPVRAQGRRVR